MVTSAIDYNEAIAMNVAEAFYNVRLIVTPWYMMMMMTMMMIDGGNSLLQWEEGKPFPGPG